MPEDHSVAQTENTKITSAPGDLRSAHGISDFMRPENTGRGADDTGKEVIMKRKVNGFYDLLLI